MSPIWCRIVLAFFLILVIWFFFGCDAYEQKQVRRAEYHEYVSKAKPGQPFVFDARYCKLQEATVETAEYSVLPEYCTGTDFYVFVKNDTIVRIKDGFFDY